MAHVDEKVMEFVESELKQDSDFATKDLFERAKARFNSIKDLSVRQFHARYPLQVKRRMSLAEADKDSGNKKKKSPKKRSRTIRRPRGSKAAAATAATAPTSPNGDREAVRKALLQFASDLSAAEERKDLVKVLADVDRYVDKVLKAAGA